ncbi:pyridoxamine 5'-phosphate oxidase family protein [Rhizobium leguminosarum]|uniref:pyridoxamine 5'-phosphate oxidase family protein n=1 Tax=Rhizobium leguminosarum TaxID=384 RepID=UPI001DC0F015|nr:pyridoxamine 5'-phosphate oxidase family protein [Rhizobium leguminosarum]MBP2445222.1 putative pyridoxamine 5'-phosphate oxidase family protein [Rhizobium leguminosarum]
MIDAIYSITLTPSVAVSRCIGRKPRVRILPVTLRAIHEDEAMDDVQSKRMILEFLRKHSLAVIATSHRNGTPEAAAIDFSVRDNLEIVFDTFEHTRKFINLSERSSVALVVGWDDSISVQYEGDAMKVSASDIAGYQEAHLKSVPVEREFVEKGAVIFRVSPRWIRYSDFTREPPEVIEVHF